MKRAIEPHLPLEEIIEDWNNISKLLSESPRKRNPQLNKGNFLIKQLSAYGAPPRVFLQAQQTGFGESGEVVD